VTSTPSSRCLTRAPCSTTTAILRSLRILVSVEGEDARRLERIAEARGKKPGDVVAELLRDVDRPAA
jgi:hypothetical protein